MMVMKQPVKVILNMSPVYGSLVDNFRAVMNPLLYVWCDFANEGHSDSASKRDGRGM